MDVLLLSRHLLSLNRSCVVRLMGRWLYLAQDAGAAADVGVVVGEVDVLRLVFLAVMLDYKAAFTAVGIAYGNLRLWLMNLTNPEI